MQAIVQASVSHTGNTCFIDSETRNSFLVRDEDGQVCMYVCMHVSMYVLFKCMCEFQWIMCMNACMRVCMHACKLLWDVMISDRFFFRVWKYYFSSDTAKLFNLYEWRILTHAYIHMLPIYQNGWRCICLVYVYIYIYIYIYIYGLRICSAFMLASPLWRFCTKLCIYLHIYIHVHTYICVHVYVYNTCRTSRYTNSRSRVSPMPASSLHKWLWLAALHARTRNLPSSYR